jgi:hypothetical protein
MEPHSEEPKVPKPRTEEKPKRFRIVKLEERIAPTFGGGGQLSHKVVCSGFCGSGSK